jgi:hypothetical protein
MEGMVGTLKAKTDWMYHPRQDAQPAFAESRQSRAENKDQLRLLQLRTHTGKIKLPPPKQFREAVVARLPRQSVKSVSQTGDNLGTYPLNQNGITKNSFYFYLAILSKTTL